MTRSRPFTRESRPRLLLDFSAHRYPRRPWWAFLFDL